MTSILLNPDWRKESYKVRPPLGITAGQILQCTSKLERDVAYNVSKVLASDQLISMASNDSGENYNESHSNASYETAKKLPGSDSPMAHHMS